MTLTIELDEEQNQRLEDAARRLNVTAPELARAAINDLLSRQDDDFERTIERVLKKNAELYRRLA
jgi:predicted transcriptional regulator